MLVGMSGRALAWVGGTVVVMVAAGIGSYLGMAGLSGASELAAVVAAFVGLGGLGVAVYGVVQAHRDAVAADSHGPSGEQSVTNTTARSVTQVKGAAGNVRVAGSSSAASPAPTTSPPPTVPPPALSGTIPGNGQTVAGSSIGGDVTQVDGVGGDVNIDR